jgi:hypothetical protein
MAKARKKSASPKKPDFDAPKQVIFDVIGSSGTENFAGYISEDYLTTLQGADAADVYDKMRRGDYQIKMALNSVKHPLKSAIWEIHPFDDSEDAQYKANLCKHIIFEGMSTTFTEFLTEALTLIDFGFSVFERQHKIVLDHPQFGNYVGIKKLHWRSPRTIERWNIDPKDEALVSVTQMAYGDGQKTVDIPAKNLVLFHWDKEGNNFEGISMLRPCYGPYKRKQVFLKLLAIGIEKYSVPTPVGKAASGQGPGSPQYEQFKLVLRKYLTHQEQYLILPDGWDVDLKVSDFDPEKTRQAIDAEDRAITKAFLANFLELGINSSSGSRAVSTDLSDFFLSGLKQVGALIVEKFNRQIIPELMRLNFGDRENMPYMQLAGIDDTVGLEFAQALSALASGKILQPDDRLEAHVRERYNLPEIESDTRRDTAPTPALFSERAIRAAEKTARGQIDEASSTIREVMKKNLKNIGGKLIASMVLDLKKTDPKKWPTVIKDKKARGMTAYVSELKDVYAQTAFQAQKRAEQEVPVNIAASDEFFKALATEVVVMLKAEAALIAKTQIADVEKQVFHQFTSSITSTDSIDVIADDLEQALEKHVDGPSIVAGAGITAAKIINESRNAYFFKPEVLKPIHSFTFINPNPKSAVCQDLAGRTFRKDDPEAQRYFPPLHHNCKSYLRPNLAPRELDPRGLAPSTKAAHKAITL